MDVGTFAPLFGLVALFVTGIAIGYRQAIASNVAAKLQIIKHTLFGQRDMGEDDDSESGD